MENLEKQNLLVTIRGQQELQSSHSDDLEPFQHLLCGPKKRRRRVFRLNRWEVFSVFQI